MNKVERAKDLAEKLARHAESAKKIGNLEEATTFAAKAAELADKHGFEIDLKDESEQYVTIQFTEATYYEKSYMNSLAALYGVACIVRKYKVASATGAYVSLHGRQNNIDCVIHLYNASKQVMKQAHKSALAEYKAIRGYIAKTEGYEFNRSFYDGAGHGIYDAVEKARQKYAAGLMEIVSSERTAALANYESVRKVTSVSITSKNTFAFNKGLEASKDVSSGQGIGAGSLRLN